MKRILSLILVFALICVLVLPVTVQASENTGTWIELLETATVNDSGSNLAKVVGKGGVFRIKTPQYMRLTKIDILLTHPAGYAPSSVKIEYNGSVYTLNRAILDDNTTRFYGSNIPDTLYADVVIEINKTYNDYTCSYQFLSCKVSSIVTDEFVADAYAEIGGGVEYSPFVYRVYSNSEADNLNYAFQFPLIVEDWHKYDKLVFSGSVDKFALNSVRCTIGGYGLPYELSYTVSNSAGSDSITYEDSETFYYSVYDTYETSTEGITFETPQYLGKILFTLTVDVSALDRENVNNLYVYFTGLANDHIGYTIQILGVTGHIYIADTSDTSWWSKFTAFFTDLFGSDDGQESFDDLQQSSSSISQGASDIQAFEQSQQAVLDTGMTTIQNAVSYTSFMAALVFVQKYANMTFDGISKYAIVFTLPLFLGLFFYLCSRIPGITRWKPRPPKSEGGDSP